MTLDEFLAATAALESTSRARVGAADSPDALETARTELLGRKSGRLTELMRALPGLPPDARRDAGAAVNRLKTAIEAALDGRRAVLAATAPVAPALDRTMPARHQWRGAKHPVTLVVEEIVEIFRELSPLADSSRLRSASAASSSRCVRAVSRSIADRYSSIWASWFFSADASPSSFRTCWRPVSNVRVRSCSDF